MSSFKKVHLSRRVKIALAVVVIYFSIGLIFPSVKLKSSIKANKPVTTSFIVFNNPFQFSEWVPGYKNIRWINGAYGIPGSQWKMIVKNMGIESELYNEFKEYRLNQYFVYTMQNSVFIYDSQAQFIDHGGSSEVIITSTLTGKNLFWKSLFAISWFFVQKEDQAIYNKLKIVINNS